MRLETIHLTVAFLGDVEEHRLPALRDIEVKGGQHALSIEEARFWAHNRIVWAGPREPPAALSGLVTGLRGVLASRGFRAENQEFEAHVTLIRNAHVPAELPQLPATHWPVEECALVESRPSGAGRDYAILARYALN